VLHRLQSRAMAKGSAREDVVMRRGRGRIAVHRIGTADFLWRLEDGLERAGAATPGDSIALPMLAASKSGAILYMNEAMRTLVGGRLTALDRVFTDLPLRPGQVHEVAGVDGRVRVRAAVIDGPTGRREIVLFPAEAEDDASSWSLADDFPVPMLKLNVEGRVLVANRRARELLGPGTPEGRQLGELVDSLGRPVRDWIAEAARGSLPKQPEVVRARRDDRELFLQIRLGRIENAHVPELVAVLNDATELKTLEAQFVQSQKMQAIGQLAGGVAHDFNNLLTAISGHCDLLLLKHQATDPDYADLIQISQNANRAAALVGQLLAFSRKQNLQPQVLNLRDVLADHAHLLNRLVGEKIRLVLEPAEDLPTIRADRRQFEQVMMNLVVNARDAMPKGGRIEVRCAAETLAEPLVRDRATVPPGEWVVIRVRDQGVGIPADKLGKIFRAVLHHQEDRRGHRPGPVHRLRHRQADRRLHLRRFACRLGVGVPPVFSRPHCLGRADRRGDGGAAQADPPAGGRRRAAGRGRGAGARLRQPGIAHARLHRDRGGERRGGAADARGCLAEDRRVRHRRDHARPRRSHLGGRGAEGPAGGEGGVRLGLRRGFGDRAPVAHPERGVPAQAVLAERTHLHRFAPVALIAVTGC
jgi:signal transduction histidine kinase